MKNCKTSHSANRSKTLDGLPNQVDIYVGKRIKLRRKILGLTQTEISKILGLTFQQIQKYEKGENRVSASRLYDFANILQVDVNFFFNDMPLITQASSPRFIQTDNEFNHTTTPSITDPSQTNKIQQLINNFLHIENPTTAEKIFELIEHLSKSHYMQNKSL